MYLLLNIILTIGAFMFLATVFGMMLDLSMMLLALAFHVFAAILSVFYGAFVWVSEFIKSRLGL